MKAKRAAVLVLALIATLLVASFDPGEAAAATVDVDVPLVAPTITQATTTVTILNQYVVAVVAETRLNPTLDSDGVAVAELIVDRFKDPSTGATSTLAGGIGSFDAVLTFASSSVAILDVRDVLGTTTFSTTTPGQVTISATATSPSTTTPAVLAKIVVRLIGSANATTTLTLTSLEVTEAGTGLKVNQDLPASNTYQRGDSRADGVINIFDALFIALCDVGLRDVGLVASTDCHPINGAGAKADGAAGDLLNITDAFFVAQFIFGIRDEFFGISQTVSPITATSISIDDAVLAPGATQEISIRVTGLEAPGACCFSFDVTYDPNVVLLTNAVEETTEVDWGIFFDNPGTPPAGLLRVNGTKFAAPFPTGDFVVLKLVAQAIGAPGQTSTLGLTVNVFADDLGAAITGYAEVDGSVTIPAVPPTLSISDVSVDEGAGNVVLTVSLSPSTSTPVFVQYDTSDGTAVAPSDYMAVAAGSAIILAGASSTTISIPIVDDAIQEVDETFTVSLSNPIGGAVISPTASSATVTIVDNDALPTLSIADVTVDEAVGNAELAITLDSPSPSAVSVNFATSDGTATAPADYASVAATTLTIPAGATSATVQIPVNDDTLDELDETFTVTLSNATNANISATSGVATVTITDNDLPPTLAVQATISVPEGPTGATFAQIQVTLSAVSGLPISVQYATSDGTATAADSDYIAVSSSLTIPAGSLTGTIQIIVVGDETVEPDEMFTVTFSNATTASGSVTITQASTLVTIVDDDAPLPPPCALDLTLSYAAGTFTMNFTVGNLEPVTGTAWLVSQSGVVLLGSIALPIADPPTALSFSIPVAQQGTVGVLATLTTPSAGIICSVWVTIDTGQ